MKKILFAMLLSALPALSYSEQYCLFSISRDRCDIGPGSATSLCSDSNIKTGALSDICSNYDSVVSSLSRCNTSLEYCNSGCPSSLNSCAAAYNTLTSDYNNAYKAWSLCDYNINLCAKAYTSNQALIKKLRKACGSKCRKIK